MNLLKKTTLLIILVIKFNFSFALEKSPLNFSVEEKDYILNKIKITMAVDPDWYPYEKIDKNGDHQGIASDLINLISVKTGLKFELIKTKDWVESLNLAKKGQVDILSFLNQTDDRSKWLIFTEPFFIEPNVLITREEHDYISSLTKIKDETIVLPKGTSIEEKLKSKYEGINIILVESEEQAIEYVNKKKADVTVRTMTMAGYVIKNKGYFNLKIAGEIPELSNNLRIGITKNDKILQGILNKAIATITEEEIQNIVNKHVSIKVVKGFDYKLFFLVLFFSLAISGTSIFWGKKIKKINEDLRKRQDELYLTTQKLEESEILYKSIINASPNGIILSDSLGGIITSSPAADLIVEKEKEQSIVGKNILDFILESDEENLKKNIARLFDGEKIGANYYNGITLTGRNRIFEVNSELIKKDKIEDSRLVSVIQDVTEKRKIEEALLHSETMYKELAKQLEEKNKLLEEIANLDSLSGLKNRHFFNTRLEEETERANRYNKKLSLILLDIDYFKRVNDTYGHDIGDKVIKEIANMLQTSIRKSDVVARWGGEEFAILMPETDLDEAFLVGEKIRSMAESLDYSFGEKVTISLGVATWTKFDTIEILFKRVDKVLYRAKNEGRNRVCVNSQIEDDIMELLEWSDKFISGNNLIDTQHEILMKECKEILSLIMQDNHDNSYVLEKIIKLSRKIEEHFFDEEKILLDKNFTFLEEHINQHKILMEKSKELYNNAKMSNINPKEIIRYIMDDVIIGHMEKEDSKFFNLFKS